MPWVGPSNHQTHWLGYQLSHHLNRNQIQFSCTLNHNSQEASQRSKGSMWQLLLFIVPCIKTSDIALFLSCSTSAQKKPVIRAISLTCLPKHNSSVPLLFLFFEEKKKKPRKDDNSSFRNYGLLIRQPRRVSQIWTASHRVANHCTKKTSILNYGLKLISTSKK